MFRTVLCAVDLGPGSESIADWAAQFAAAFMARLCVLHLFRSSMQIALDPSIFATAAALQGIFPVVYVENYDDLQWGQLLTSGVPHPAGWRKSDPTGGVKCERTLNSAAS